MIKFPVIEFITILFLKLVKRIMIPPQNFITLSAFVQINKNVNKYINHIRSIFHYILYAIIQIIYRKSLTKIILHIKKLNKKLNLIKKKIIDAFL